jgi:hypothetical protein
LQQFGFAAENVPAKQFLAKGQLFLFGREPFRVDILTDPSGVDFSKCYRKRIEADLEILALRAKSIAKNATQSRRKTKKKKR